jgi:hypothetical protein
MISPFKAKCQKSPRVASPEVTNDHFPNTVPRKNQSIFLNVILAIGDPNKNVYLHRESFFPSLSLTQ